MQYPFLDILMKTKYLISFGWSPKMQKFCIAQLRKNTYGVCDMLLQDVTTLHFNCERIPMVCVRYVVARCLPHYTPIANKQNTYGVCDMLLQDVYHITLQLQTNKIPNRCKNDSKLGG
jgi:hypothetical protein